MITSLCFPGSLQYWPHGPMFPGEPSVQSALSLLPLPLGPSQAAVISALLPLVLHKPEANLDFTVIGELYLGLSSSQKQEACQQSLKCNRGAK